MEEHENSNGDTSKSIEDILENLSDIDEKIEEKPLPKPISLNPFIRKEGLLKRGTSSTPVFTRNNRNELPFKIKTYPLKDILGVVGGGSNNKDDEEVVIVRKDVQEKEVVSEVKETTKEPLKETAKETAKETTKEKKKKKKSKESSEESEESSESELKKRKKKAIKKKKKKAIDYNTLPFEQQDKYRARFKARFLVLKESWGDVIPDIDDNMSLYELDELYSEYIKNIQIKHNNSKYKVYIVVMWLVIEFACIKMGLNISGYTMHQLKTMNKYEKYLIEMGEKNYYNEIMGEQWSAEMNIIFLALINAVCLIVIKVLGDYLGEHVATGIVEGLQKVMTEDNPHPGMLFGGDDFDAPKMIANAGNLFLQNMAKPKNKEAAASAAKTPKVRAVYDD